MASCARWTTFFLGLIELGIAIAIICITAIQLTDYTWTNDLSDNINQFFDSKQCILGTADGNSLCNFAYIVGGISIAATLAAWLTKCITCGCCGIENIVLIFDAIFHGAGCALYVVAGIVFAKYVVQANNDWGSLSWRNSIVVLSWAGALVFGIALLVSILGIDCMSCYSGGGRKKQTPKTEKASETSDAYTSVAAKYRKKGSPGDIEAPGGQFISK